MTETLTFDLSVDPEFCAVCTKLPAIRLMLDVIVNGERHSVSVCRDCLAEYAPETLTAIEAGSTEGLSL